MKVSSHVQSDDLYHDSNGYLVSKRTLNHRPDDYQYDFKSGDLINGNTYPVCSFAYLLSREKKMVFFTDRAQGVAPYQSALLINFDRLTMDDGKGVGQAYTTMTKNTFHYKFAITESTEMIERRWQR